jgi:multidrug efflux pump subunit AcrB
VTVGALSVIVLGVLTIYRIPIDILPIFRSPAVQALTFYGGMPAVAVEKDISNRMERWTGQANGMARQESRSIIGASIVRNYFQSDADPNGALTQVNSLALGTLPTLPPGTLPPVVLPFDPTSTVPVSIVAVDSNTWPESIIYDVGRYEVRNMIMSNPGAIAPVVYGGKIRAVMVYLDRVAMQSRRMDPITVKSALDKYNLFLPAGDVKVGSTDYNIDSNSMYTFVERMGDMPLRDEFGNAAYLRDVASPQDASFIQTNIVRINGRREVYIPVYRQLGASTLAVVDTVRKNLADMQARLTRTGINLRMVMDQSVYVRSAIKALVQEGLMGAVLCSLVIVLFLGQWRMTMIAISTLPLSVLAATVGLYAAGQTINVMTLAGLTMAIGPMVDSAIICLENTHRHLGMGDDPEQASFLGASEVAMPELISTLCTFLVLSPLALMPGMGRFLFLPMTYAVAFAMTSAYILSRTLVPSFSALLLRPHATHDAAMHSRNPIRRAFAAWEGLIDRGIALYVSSLGFVIRRRRTTVIVAYSLLGIVLVVLAGPLRRDFFPEVDSGAFQIIVRAPSGTRIELTEQKIAQVEQFIHEHIPEHDLELVLSEIGVTPDWSAAYTPNAGPMDAVMKVQLAEDRSHSAQHYAEALRDGFRKDPKFTDLEFSFDTGGLIRGALNEGKATPINIQITDKELERPHAVAEAMKRELTGIPGLVDVTIVERLNYPEFVINVDRAKAADVGLSQQGIMQSVVAATNCSISFDKSNFWIDPVSHNQYFVGVQYPEANFQTLDDVLNIPITSPRQTQPVLLRQLATITRAQVPTEVSHVNIQPTINVTMGVQGRDIGHVAAEVARVVDKFGDLLPDGTWATYDPASKEHKTIEGSKISLTGEYGRMQDTFKNLAIGLLLASLLIYFLMVALDKSWIVPLAVMLIVPLCLTGVLPFLYLTGSALNVQSLLGIIFIVGIKVANTVLMTDVAQELRRHEGMSAREAILKAAAMRVRPVTMTALAAFFAMIPGALALERGAEANAPLARAILGGLIAGEPATLFVLPALYAWMVRDSVTAPKPALTEESSHGHH